MSAQQYYNGTAAPPAGSTATPPGAVPAAPSMSASRPYAPASYIASSDPEAAREKRGLGGGAADTAPFSQATDDTGARLRPRARLNDPVLLALFVAAFVGYCVVSGLALAAFVSVDGLGGGFGSAAEGGTGAAATLDYHTIYLFLIVCAVGLLGAALWLALARAFTRAIMEVTLAACVLLNIGTCIYYFYIGYYSGAVIFVVIAIFSIFFYFASRRRIPLARLLFQVTMDVSKHHPSVYVVALIGLLVQTAWSVWYAFTCVAIYVKWTPGSATCGSTSCSSSKVAGLIFYATFDYLWTSQVIANVVLTTLSGGVYGGWYYYGPRAAASGVPRRASLLAFMRSATLSLGSIAFGSLIVTVLELVRMLLQALQGYEAGQGDVVGQILSCCAVCCIGCIQGMIQWFNKSLYGKAYIPAAKDTWRLLKDRGIDALINDNIVGSVILIGSYVNGFLCALFGYLYLKFTDPAYNSSGQYSAPIILYSFLIGIMEMTCVGSAIDAGVSTIFVGLGEDPMVLAERSPALFDMIRQTYPRVVEGVPH